MEEQDDSDVSHIMKFTCLTKSVKKHISFKWIIANFSFLYPKGEQCLTSSHFPRNPYNDERWYLKLYPKRQYENEEEYISIYLCYSSNNVEATNASYKIAFIDYRGREIKSIHSKRVRTFNVQQGWGSSYFYRRSDLMKNEVTFLPNDELTVVCEVTWVEESKAILKDGFVQETDLIETSKVSIHPSDVTLVCKDKVIPVHKCILSVRSNKFQKMFAHDPFCKRFAISDMDAGMLIRILIFIYKDSLDGIEDEEDFEDLLRMAYDYGITSLLTRCEVELAKDINGDNVLDLLNLADDCKAVNLKRAAINFLHSTNVEKLEKTKTWQTLLETKYDLMADILNEVTKSSKGLKRKYQEIEEPSEEPSEDLQ